MAAVLALHAIVLVALLARRTPPPPKPPSVEAIVLRIIEARPHAPVAPPPPPDVRNPVLAQLAPVPPTFVIAETAPRIEAWPSGTCSPLDAIGRALAADPRARAAIADAPPGVRSEAGAIALWNGAWASAAATGAAPLAPLREMVERTLAAAPRECLDTAETGPRLVPVHDAARPTLIVLGSGVWRWRDLIPVTKRGV